MAEDRFPVFATRMNHKLIEIRLRSARNGYDLLKAKSNALQIHYKKLEERFNSTNQSITELFRKAFLSLSRAEFYGANIDVFKKKCLKSDTQIETTIELVCGLVLPRFRAVRAQDPVEDILSSGGSKLMETKMLFDGLLYLLVEVASMRGSFLVLKSMLDMTNRRVNALEHMLIPKLERTLVFINGELDEQERENFYKLKKIQGLNK